MYAFLIGIICDLFDFRQGVARSGEWRFSQVNEEFALCPSYPATLVVPSTVSDEMLHLAAKQRSKGRIPVLTWLHPNGSSLFRSSQPLSGLVARCTDDEALLKCIRQTVLSPANDQYPADDDEDCWTIIEDSEPCSENEFTRPKRNRNLRILDCRPLLNAQGNVLLGKGFENVSRIGDGTTIEFANIANIHVMRDSFRALRLACLRLTKSSQISPSFDRLDLIESFNFDQLIADSKWLNHISDVRFICPFSFCLRVIKM